MKLDLEGQATLVTGSSRGIGRVIAASFVEEGAHVVFTGRNAKTLEEATNELGDISYRKFVGDLCDDQTLERLAEFVRSEFGALDHLVCNLGSGRTELPLLADESEVQRMIDINFSSAVAAVRAFLPLLSKAPRNPKTSKSITFIGSICSKEALGCPDGYAAAKAALAAYSRNIVRPLARKGIRVNIVTPGNIMFPGSTWETKWAKDRNAVEAMLEGEVPIRRFGTPEEVANVVIFLASPRAGFVTGADWVVDGGQTRS